MAQKVAEVVIEEVFGDSEQALSEAIHEYYINQPAEREVKKQIDEAA